MSVLLGRRGKWYRKCLSRDLLGHHIFPARSKHPLVRPIMTTTRIYLPCPSYAAFNIKTRELSSHSRREDIPFLPMK